MRNNETPALVHLRQSGQVQKKDKTYPYSVTFIPDTQISMFEDDNINTDTGEVGELTVTVGLSTTVKSTLKFRMESSLFKKLIKLAEQVGELYYQAFREEHGARIKPTRPDRDNEEEFGYIDCPACGHLLDAEKTPAFCPDCGQALDWTPEPVEPEQDEFDAALEMLEDLIEEAPEA